SPFTANRRIASARVGKSGCSRRQSSIAIRTLSFHRVVPPAIHCRGEIQAAELVGVPSFRTLRPAALHHDRIMAETYYGKRKVPSRNGPSETEPARRAPQVTSNCTNCSPEPRRKDPAW